MGRLTDSSSIVLSLSEDSPREGRDRSSRSKPVNEIMDPLHCALCSGILMCPRDKDYDKFMEQTNLKCLGSSDPICKRAVGNSSNAAYIERIKSDK
jgi:hypothetical protein